MRLQLAIFAKQPLLGRVKTRLIPALGEAGALAAHKGLLQHVASQAEAWLAHDPSSRSIVLWGTPESDDPFFHQLLPEATLSTQQGEDLGERLYHGLCRGLARSDGVILLGGDGGSVTTALLESASQALHDHPAALCPTEDGGYIALALRQALPELFQAMPWGGEAVAQETRKRLQQQGLAWWESPLQWDVDEPADWHRFQAAQAGQGAANFHH
uniref:Glycosyltransferase n=1 Tax=Magnetococcus massalia (strain MO-1) TaxID=451514 RepID=A0A1S7LED3_MAGMO|nr:conserved protein of unknown function [Candidatus Magnetococcus massalia]